MISVLIIAHGQPSDPAPAGAELAGFARQVAALMPEARVISATLAEPAALAGAVRELGQEALVYPMFMAGGWFVRAHLPARLREAGAVGWRVLEPLGCDPALHDLAAEVVAEMGAARVLLAAHGSFKSPVPSDVAYHVARRIAAGSGARVEAAFIDQAPRLADAKGYGSDSVCLPFFAAAGGHVTQDIPQALVEAGFQGRILPALGTDARVAGLVARAIRRAEPVCATECRLKRG